MGKYLDEVQRKLMGINSPKLETIRDWLKDLSDGKVVSETNPGYDQREIAAVKGLAKKIYDDMTSHTANLSETPYLKNNNLLGTENADAHNYIHNINFFARFRTDVEAELERDIEQPQKTAPAAPVFDTAIGAVAPAVDAVRKISEIAASFEKGVLSSCFNRNKTEILKALNSICDNIDRLTAIENDLDDTHKPYKEFLLRLVNETSPLRSLREKIESNEIVVDSFVGLDKLIDDLKSTSDKLSKLINKEFDISNPTLWTKSLDSVNSTIIAVRELNREVTDLSDSAAKGMKTLADRAAELARNAAKGTADLAGKAARGTADLAGKAARGTANLARNAAEGASDLAHSTADSIEGIVHDTVALAEQVGENIADFNHRATQATQYALDEVAFHLKPLDLEGIRHDAKKLQNASDALKKVDMALDFIQEELNKKLEARLYLEGNADYPAAQREILQQQIDKYRKTVARLSQRRDELVRLDHRNDQFVAFYKKSVDIIAPLRDDFDKQLTILEARLRSMPSGPERDKYQQFYNTAKKYEDFLDKNVAFAKKHKDDKNITVEIMNRNFSAVTNPEFIKGLKDMLSKLNKDIEKLQMPTGLGTEEKKTQKPALSKESVVLSDSVAERSAQLIGALGSTIATGISQLAYDAKEYFFKAMGSIAHSVENIGKNISEKVHQVTENVTIHAYALSLERLGKKIQDDAELLRKYPALATLETELNKKMDERLAIIQKLQPTANVNNEIRELEDIIKQRKNVLSSKGLEKARNLYYDKLEEKITPIRDLTNVVQQLVQDIRANDPKYSTPEGRPLKVFCDLAEQFATDIRRDIVDNPENIHAFNISKITEELKLKMGLLNSRAPNPNTSLLSKFARIVLSVRSISDRVADIADSISRTVLDIANKINFFATKSTLLKDYEADRTALEKYSNEAIEARVAYFENRAALVQEQMKASPDNKKLQDLQKDIAGQIDKIEAAREKIDELKPKVAYVEQKFGKDKIKDLSEVRNRIDEIMDLDKQFKQALQSKDIPRDDKAKFMEARSRLINSVEKIKTEILDNPTTVVPADKMADLDDSLKILKKAFDDLQTQNDKIPLTKKVAEALCKPFELIGNMGIKLGSALSELGKGFTNHARGILESVKQLGSNIIDRIKHSEIIPSAADAVSTLRDIAKDLEAFSTKKLKSLSSPEPTKTQPEPGKGINKGTPPTLIMT